MVFTEIENRKKSFAYTTALFALLFLLFFYLKFSDQMLIPELEGGGGGGEVAVNFGDSDFGSGDNFQSMEKVVSAPRQVKTAAAPEKEIIVSENDDAPAIAEVKKPAEKPKKVEEKPVEKVVPKPSKSTTDALSNLLNGSNKSGDGDDKVAGNKGKSTGDPNARGYNGGGGSGTGSGGGNGSGEGLGTGSGYGNGSGNGRGNGNGNYQLSGRKFLSTPPPQYTCNEQGTVVVQITVDKNGKVTNAQPGVRGTTNAAKCLLDQAKIAALNTVVNASEDAPEKQVGKIIYTFKLTGN
jgi:outer membrane biosynthesis protein TonB